MPARGSDCRRASAADVREALRQPAAGAVWLWGARRGRFRVPQLQRKALRKRLRVRTGDQRADAGNRRAARRLAAFESVRLQRSVGSLALAIAAAALSPVEAAAGDCRPYLS